MTKAPSSLLPHFYEAQQHSGDLDNLHSASPAEGRNGLKRILAQKHFWIKLEKVMKLTVVILDFRPESQFKWSMESKMVDGFQLAALSSHQNGEKKKKNSLISPQLKKRDLAKK